MPQIMSALEERVTSIAWMMIEEYIYKNPYIPCSPLRPSDKQIEFLAYNGEEALYGGSVGGGKPQPLTAKVLTPKGWKNFGDLKVGDIVSDPTNGGSTEVIKIFPQGEIQIYKVTFDDGASCEVGMDHLWLYKPNSLIRMRPRTKKSSQREFAIDKLGAEPPKTRWDSLRVGTTNDIIDLMNQGVSCQIPLSEPILYTVNGRTGSGGVDPYIAGVLLGDGHIGTLRITACDDDIRDYLVNNGFNALSQMHSDGKPKTYSPIGRTRELLQKWIINHGLRGKKSFDKFIPKYVFTSPIEYRLAFLQGLMDTDGTADERGRCYFISTSEELTRGVIELVRSLGGKAKIRNRQTQYTSQGIKKNGLPSFQTRIWMRKLSSVFRVKRKKNRCTDKWNGGDELMRTVTNIEPTDVQEAMCIKVSSPYGLYITNDFIVTHNSDALLMAALMFVSIPNYSAIIFRRTYGQLVGDGGLVPRSKEWIGDKAIFREKNMAWSFPSGATLTFGYFDHDDDRNKYLGGAWQTCCWDEATWFKQPWYEFMFSRLRKPSWICKNCGKPIFRWDFVTKEFHHKKPGECNKAEPLPMPVNHLGMSLADVPIRVRAASNPGGPSHEYFKRRFVVENAPKHFVRALLDDNPGLDHDDYNRKLNKLDPVTRAQYRYGDWNAYQGGRIKKNWFREFWVEADRSGHPVYKWSATDVNGNLHPGWPTCPFDGVSVSKCFNFITCDPASTEGDKNDYTAIGVFAVTPNNEILVLDIVREKMDLEMIVPRIGKLAADYNAMFVGIEDVAFQRGIIREGQRTLGVPVERLPTEGKSKLVRATPAIIRASEGQYFIPKDEPQGKFPWLDDFLGELVAFTGDEKVDSFDDQVDCFGYSALSLLRHGLLSPDIINPEENDDDERKDPGIFMSDGDDRFDIL